MWVACIAGPYITSVIKRNEKNSETQVFGAVRTKRTINHENKYTRKKLPHENGERDEERKQKIKQFIRIGNSLFECSFCAVSLAFFAIHFLVYLPFETRSNNLFSFLLNYVFRICLCASFNSRSCVISILFIHTHTHNRKRKIVMLINLLASLFESFFFVRQNLLKSCLSFINAIIRCMAVC